MSLLLQQLAKDVFGAQGDPVHTPGWLDGNVDVFGYHWPYRQMFTIVLALNGDLAAADRVLREVNTFMESGTNTLAHVQMLHALGKDLEAGDVFEKVLTYASPLGLYSEEIAPTGEQLGNFPAVPAKVTKFGRDSD